MQICLFDIDGTLLDTGGAGQAAMEAALENEFGIRAPTVGISTAGRTDRAITADLFEFHGISADARVLDQFIAAYLQELPNSLRQNEGLVLPGIPALLEALNVLDDVVLGLLTGNYREGAHLKLEFYGLDHHFEFGGFGDEHLHRNDVARAAIDEAQRSGNRTVTPDRVWVIGDTPADVQCGRAIGAQIVAVGTGMYSTSDLAAADPDHLFSDFSDPTALLELLR